MPRTPGKMFAFALASVALIGPLAVHLFLPVIPAIKVALDLSDATAQATFSIALIGMAASTLFYGTLADKYGRRPVLLSGLALFLFGSFLSFLAPSVSLLIAGRFVQALGAGCGITLVRAIARDAYGAERLVKAIAYLTMFYTLGPMVAPIAGGMLVDAFGWRSVFFFSLVGGGAIMLGVWLAIYETKPEGAGVAKGESVARGYYELLSNLRFDCFVLQTGFNTGAFLVAASGAALLMKEMLHRPATEYGFWFLLFPIGFFCGNFVSSRIGAKGSVEGMVALGCTLAGLTVVVLSLLLIVGYVTPPVLFIPGFFITFAQGIALPYGQSGAMAVNPRLAGTASGIGACTQNLVAAGMVQLFGFLSDGTVYPLVIVASLSASCGLVAGIYPWLLARSARA